MLIISLSWMVNSSIEFQETEEILLTDLFSSLAEVRGNQTNIVAEIRVSV